VTRLAANEVSLACAGRIVASGTPHDVITPDTMRAVPDAEAPELGRAVSLAEATAVQAESDALAAIRLCAIWQTLPFVADDGVVIVDRLGNPGAQRLIQFYGEIAPIDGAAGD
jgi:hypothetical protein